MKKLTPLLFAAGLASLAMTTPVLAQDKQQPAPRGEAHINQPVTQPTPQKAQYGELTATVAMLASVAGLYFLEKYNR